MGAGGALRAGRGDICCAGEGQVASMPPGPGSRGRIAEKGMGRRPPPGGGKRCVGTGDIGASRACCRDGRERSRISSWPSGDGGVDRGRGHIRVYIVNAKREMVD